MDSKSTPTPPRVRDADIAAATAHLKESWEHGKNVAGDARRSARESWQDLSRNVEQYVETRPKTTALWALGAGVAIGFLSGFLVSRAVRAPSSTV